MTGCLNPKLVRNPYNGELVQVPCGSCSACRSLKSFEWASRLDIECSMHKYSLFGTLTYHDSALPRKHVGECLFSDKEALAVVSSSDYIRLCNGNIPCVRMRDFSLFIKRVRNYLKRDFHISSKEATLRYFCVSEYGPSSFRPHFHYLLWYDSSAVNACIKSCIYKAWFSQSGNQKISSFFERNKHSLVRFRASQYVAGYLCCSADLPPILYTREFRTKHVQSIAPSIGLACLSSRQIQTILSGRIGVFNFTLSFNSKVKSVPFWLSLESRFFPRCRSFSTLSSFDRRLLYTLPASFASKGGLSSFVSWVECEVATTSNSALLFRSLFSATKDLFLNDARFRYDSLRRIYYTSVRFVRNLELFGLDVESYLRLIDFYYSYKDYQNLCSQLQTEVEFSNGNFEGYDLSYYPCYVDPCFVGNGRKLKSFDLYLSQFGLTDFSVITHSVKDSTPWRQSRDMFRKIVNDNTKTRRKRDYLSSHPEFANIYRANLFRSFI